MSRTAAHGLGEVVLLAGDANTVLVLTVHFLPDDLDRGVGGALRWGKQREIEPSLQTRGSFLHFKGILNQHLNYFIHFLC